MVKFVSNNTAFVDPDGVVIGIAQKESVIRYTDRYVFRFENDWMGWLAKTNSVTTPKVFYALTCMLNYGSAEVYLDPEARKKLKEEYQMSEVSLCASLNELERAGVIIRGRVIDKATGEQIASFGRGRMMFNPCIAWRGESKDRDAAMKVYLSYLEYMNGGDYEKE